MMSHQVLAMYSSTLMYIHENIFSLSLSILTIHLIIVRIERLPKKDRGPANLPHHNACPLRLEVVLVKDSNSNLGREGRDLRWKKVREVKVRSLTGRNVNHGRTALRRELPRLPQSFALLSSYAGAGVPVATSGHFQPSRVSSSSSSHPPLQLPGAG